MEKNKLNWILLTISTLLMIIAIIIPSIITKWPFYTDNTYLGLYLLTKLVGFAYFIFVVVYLVIKQRAKGTYLALGALALSSLLMPLVTRLIYLGINNLKQELKIGIFFIYFILIIILITTLTSLYLRLNNKMIKTDKLTKAKSISIREINEDFSTLKKGNNE
ncbi:hypothetical protein [Mycoplasmopsis columbina]|uniref:hypothetical protein n=1 Tax=Mycoplasmopsis columbina TaxID=114881 RepID=UPI0004A6C14A|nr:hypothetical protein [Mycoplasmopsis columbina]VEU76766.1 Uncharacterised protein [Mycoplasmopsis columbina]